MIDRASDLLLRVDNTVHENLHRVLNEEPCILSGELFVNIVTVFPNKFHNVQ